MLSVLIRVFGKVQGVSFRFHIKKLASQYHVAGWVRNRADGSVEAVFQGDATYVQQLVEWCRQGPDEAEVAHVDVAATDVDRTLSGFTVRPTC